MNVLVTGGAGFIGKHLVRALELAKHNVDVIDKASGPSLRQAPWGVGYDVVYHLAAASSVTASDEDHFEDTLMSTTMALRRAEYAGCKRFIFVSSGAVYGNTSRLRECQPISVYGACKLGSEGLVSAWAERTGGSYFIARPGNVVGRGSVRGVILDTIRKLKDDPTRLTVLGSGATHKSFVLVDDVVPYLVGWMAPERTEGQSLADLRPGSTTTVRDVIVACCEELGVRPEIAWGTERRGWVGDMPYPGGFGLYGLRHSNDAVRIAIREIAQEVLNG